MRWALRFAYRKEAKVTRSPSTKEYLGPDSTSVAGSIGKPTPIIVNARDAVKYATLEDAIAALLCYDTSTWLGRAWPEEVE